LFDRGAQAAVERIARAAQWWLDAANNVNNDPHRNGEYWLVRSCDGMTTFADVGFNRGDWSRFVLSTHPTARVWAFDPDSGAAKAAAEFADSRMQLFPVALAAASGVAEFVSFGECNPSNSLAQAHHDHPASEARQTRSVRVRTLDDWASEHALTGIDFLKVDAEGHDFDVLLGATQLFGRKQVGVAVFEYGYRWLDAGHLLVEADRFFRDHGYLLFRLFPRFLAPYTWQFRHENLLAGQFVAVRPDLVSRFAVRERSL
jgi:FkbM family methyltransferase